MKERKRDWKRWTQANEIELLTRRAAREELAQIAVALRRPYHGIRDRLRGLNAFSPEAASRALARMSTPPGDVDEIETVPADALVDRERLLEARTRQSRASALLGDPPPGFSALDYRTFAPSLETRETCEELA